MNVTDKMKIEEIIKNLTEEDMERISVEVEYLDKKLKLFNFTNVFIDTLLGVGMDSEAIRLGVESFEYEGIAGNAIWDCLTAILKRTYALESYMSSME